MDGKRPPSVYILGVGVAVLLVFSAVMTVLKVKADRQIELLNSSLSKARNDLKSGLADADAKLRAEKAANEAARQEAEAKLQRAESRLPKGSFGGVTHSHGAYDSDDNEGVKFSVQAKTSNLHNTPCGFYAYFYDDNEKPVNNSYGSHLYFYTSFTPNSASYDTSLSVFMPYSTVPSQTTYYKVKFVIKRSSEVIAESGFHRF